MLVKKSVIIKSSNANEKSGIVKITCYNGVTELTLTASGVAINSCILGLAVNGDFHILPVKCGIPSSIACDVAPSASLLCVILDQATQDTLMEGSSGLSSKDYTTLLYELKSVVRSSINRGAKLSARNTATIKARTENDTLNENSNEARQVDNNMSAERTEMHSATSEITAPNIADTANQASSPEAISAEAKPLPEGIEIKGFMQEEEAAPRTAFYDSVREQVERLFAENPRCEELNRAIAESKWVAVRTENSHYVVGVLYKDGEITHICYGVPGYYNSKPESEASMEWLPIDKELPEGDGYWVIYQDAVNGNTISPC